MPFRDDSFNNILFMLQTWWPVHGWGGLYMVGRANHIFTLPPEKGAQIHCFFGAQPPAGWLVAPLLLIGDVEQNLGPGRKWQCSLCSLYIKTKSQTSLCCNHTTLGTHNMHKHNLNPIHKLLEMCTMHTAQIQPTHSKTNTNQSLPTSPQTATATSEYTHHQGEPATSPSMPSTP